ncbi:hypothetical protein GUITHDRAFT_140898 [Guillardia theta CCMP2712]|uniref:ADF-H domain-containing protein n=1 Tax=Guillardia theta (strain CCMP2712) TaxID=905079 RepID=L1IPI3_GUITC|nr:hypothetical protein GUITHDRAFT_97114 [Guillardia theta CCMP2712]XP_005830032.1 hypothetical protein GUITHDRAFT_140898 [Guillardia theta CCMP2712]EKX37730.1 hypothetical protein GUITHDRAFT_97114 [Guillardia theta CCMP2712]EKX43052.1 hypothetical protein GUITHDRAFT_140898 [Guillardia theta CCMP2712]|eukprot:XP_005824710.1 hypothetical protein GUITHDRAFT_97114 [Guillardia theta CCMP2712]
MASGVGVADDCVSVFNDLKLKHSMKYIVYNMNDKMTEIQVMKTGGKEATYEEFLKELPENDCRYGVFDVEYTDPKTKASRNKIAFFIWCPDTAKVRTKMIFASSKDELKKRLVGIACEVQGSDAGDVALETVVDRLQQI